MISRRLRSVAADSNVLRSAVVGNAALKIFLHTDIEVYTTAFNIEETREYLPLLGNKYALDSNCLLLQLKMLPIHIVKLKEYEHKLLEARTLIGQRDIDDAHLLALALSKGMALWSNGKDFNAISAMDVFPTGKLLKLYLL